MNRYVGDLLATFIQEGQVAAIVSRVHDEFGRAGRVISEQSLKARYDEAVTKAIAMAYRA